MTGVGAGPDVPPRGVYPRFSDQLLVRTIDQSNDRSSARTSEARNRTSAAVVVLVRGNGTAIRGDSSLDVLGETAHDVRSLLIRVLREGLGDLVRDHRIVRAEIRNIARDVAVADVDEDVRVGVTESLLVN